MCNYFFLENLIKKAYYLGNMDRQTIRNLALQNAVKFNGKANPGAVIGHILGSHPEAKAKMKELAKEVNDIIKEVNKISAEKQREELEKNAPDLLIEKVKEEKHELKELEDVNLKKGVIMRFAPSPSGPMHIGHAITGGLTCLYVKKYGGKFILRIEDTNSDNIDPAAYDMLPKDAEWIFGNVTDVWIQSDRMKFYYDYVEKLIDKNAVYVCTCSQEEFKKYTESMTECPCRNLEKREQLTRWKNMFDKKAFKEGDAVVRFKSDMKDKNPAMRDFPLARINDSEHPRQKSKYRVWPLMNLAVTVDDIEAGMTHIIRAKDHADNAKRQEKIFNALGLKYPHSYFTGRYNFEGLEISCSKTKAKIKEGLFTGWDDIKVPFLVALKRRGYQPEAFLKYTMLTGLSPVDKTVPAEEFFKAINSFNKEIIDKKASRYFFVKNPKKIKIKNAPKKDAEIDMHPDFKEKGKRKLKTSDEFYVEDELEKGKNYRFMHLFNFRNNEFVSEELDDRLNAKMIHWLPVSKDLVDVEVMMPDAKTVKGLAESGVKDLKVNSIVQFERFGFCRLDSIEKGKYKFWFAHR
jgi:glutamyl-tRNA synthetase